jgi:hypothetical protein
MGEISERICKVKVTTFGDTVTEMVDVLMTLWTFIREVLGSKLSRTPVLLLFLVVFLTLSRQIPGEYLDYITAVSFHILSNSSSYHSALYTVV